MKKLWTLLFWFLTIIGLEFLLKANVFETISDANIYYLIIFSFLNAFAIYVVTTIFNKKVSKILSFIFLIVIVFFFIAEFIYFNIFTAFFTLDAISMVEGAFPFVRAIFEILWNKIFIILLFLLPIIVYIFVNKYFGYSKDNVVKVLIKLLVLLNVFCLAVLSLNLTDKEDELYSPKKLYFNVYYPYESVRSFGLLTTLRLDLKRLVSNTEETSEYSNESSKEYAITEYDYNVMDIDWDSLIANESNQTIKNMHTYFSSLNGTQKNEYTGLFEGKNLIFIVAESLYTPFINETLTPTLYNLYNNGIVFDNYYPSKFEKSTTDTEYMLFTSIVPKIGVSGGSADASKRNYFPFTIGNSFSDVGYYTIGFHNWTNGIYDRRTYIPNYGFKYYDGPQIGITTDPGGFNIKTVNFPSSDLDLVEKTYDMYIDEEQFLTYYITVSGHFHYEYRFNKMVKKNWNIVKNMDYSTKVKGYIACNLEFEFAMERLIELLTEKGILEDTVIIISTDHYPYNLSINEMKELNDEEFSEPISVNKSKLLIYNSATSPKVISKVAASIDVLPTILNLFNIEFDSRLMMGNDLFSDSEGVAIFSDRSFITDYGYYSASKKETVIYDRYPDINDEYFENLKLTINNKFKISSDMLDTNYYSKVFESGD